MIRLVKIKHLFLFFLSAWLWFFIPVSLSGQCLQPDNPDFPSVSKNGILFQCCDSASCQIVLLSSKTDSVFRYRTYSKRPQHPVWVPGKAAFVFDSGSGINSRLYYYNLRTKRQRGLIPYKMACREASFTPSRHLAIFSGYDDRSGYWQIFSYDFVYGNVNRLTSEQGNCLFPVFSPNGKQITYLVQSENGKQYLKCMNWYGEANDTLSENVYGKACWTPDSYRILYVSQQGDHFVLMSVTGDNSGKKEIYSSSVPIKSPALSADGKMLYLIKKDNGQFRLVHVPFVFSATGNFSIVVNSNEHADQAKHKGYPQKYWSGSK